MRLRIPPVPVRALGAFLLVGALFTAYTVPTSAAPSPSAVVETGSVTLAHSIAADGPSHHFGFSQASVLAQATAATITKSDAPDPVTAGNNVTYTITVTNPTAAAVTAVSVSDTLPAGLTLTGTPSSTVGSCTGTAGTSTFSCTIGTLAAGQVATITATALVPATTGDMVVTNIATLNFTGPDAVPQTASAAASTTVTAAPGAVLNNQIALQRAQAAGLVAGQAGVPCAGFGSGGVFGAGQTGFGFGQPGFGQPGFGQPGFGTTGIGQSCQITGATTGSCTLTGTGGVTCTVTGTSTPASGAGTPIAVFTTTIGNEFIPCTPVGIGATTATCTGTLVGVPLQGSSVAVVFPAPGGVSLGTITGPGGVAPFPPGVFPPFPLLPPPPLEFIPPPPPPLLPPPPGIFQQPAMAMPAFPEVPVIPEADTVFLVVGGLVVLGAAAGLRSVRRRKE